MRFLEGLNVGCHGPIRYFVKTYIKGKFVAFEFTKTPGFNGVHYFKFEEITQYETRVTHIIDMKLTGTGLLTWPLFIKCLHDALAEDALDKVQNQFDKGNRKTKWNFWVLFLRKLLG
jgi:hypothetical protein